MSFLCDSNFWHWYCCCYCCCKPLNDTLDNLGECFCYITGMYETEDNSAEDDDDITLDIVVGESLIEFNFDSADDSLDDEEYYEIYPYSTRKDSLHQFDVKSSKTAESMENARQLWNTKHDTMTKGDYFDIRDYYYNALLSSPEQFKRKIIKEYESFVNSYDYEKDTYSYTVQAELEKARDTGNDKETRCAKYRYAIVNTADTHTKKDLKKEYNSFLRYS